MKFLTTTLVLVAFLSGCVKNNSQEFTISGRLLQGCTNQPVANQELIIDQLIAANWALQTSGGELGKTTTDAKGNFSINYKPKNERELRIQVSAGVGFSTLMDRIPIKDITDLNVRIGDIKTTIQVKINVIKPYTSNDTLFVTDFRNLSTKLKVPGPFQSGTLYTTEFPLTTYVNYEPNNLINLGYKINNNDWILKPFNQTPCDSSIVTVDIN